MYEINVIPEVLWNKIVLVLNSVTVTAIVYQDHVLHFCILQSVLHCFPDIFPGRTFSV